MTPEEKKEFEIMNANECKRLRNIFAADWAKLTLYLEAELLCGNREFRIAFQDDNQFVIHPLGKDGKTIDLYLSR